MTTPISEVAAPACIQSYDDGHDQEASAVRTWDFVLRDATSGPLRHSECRPQRDALYSRRNVTSATGLRNEDGIDGASVRDWMVARRQLGTLRVRPPSPRRPNTRGAARKGRSGDGFRT